MKKIITILGARPQFIKAAAVSRAIAEYNEKINTEKFIINELTVHTGQHFDPNMSDVFFDELGMEKPTYHLDIHGGGHGEMTGRMLIAIEKVLLLEQPDCVLVYGDTNSTLAGALAATKLHIPVAHVEAGLRSFNMAMPEEINRILTDRVSSILFCPTETAVQNLVKEGFELLSDQRTPPTGFQPLVINVGDVMYDAALYHGTQITESGGVLGSLSISHGIKPGNYCLATIHRGENTDHPERLQNIFAALCEFSKKIPVILPIHPRTRKILASLDRQLFITDHQSLILIDPVGYFDMVQLEKHASLIATDSGGVQKEAFFYNVPCVTLRNETEWMELIAAGWNRLAPPVSKDSILTALFLAVGTTGLEVQPYGDGNAAKRILQYLQVTG